MTITDNLGTPLGIGDVIIHDQGRNGVEPKRILDFAENGKLRVESLRWGGRSIVSTHKVYKYFNQEYDRV